jgi:hypothetical protein
MSTRTSGKTALTGIIFGGLTVLLSVWIMASMRSSWKINAAQEQQKQQYDERILAVSAEQKREIDATIRAEAKVALNSRKRIMESEASGFGRRRDETWAAFNRKEINLAEREGLLARIRDEEEKLKRRD